MLECSYVHTSKKGKQLNDSKQITTTLTTTQSTPTVLPHHLYSLGVTIDESAYLSEPAIVPTYALTTSIFSEPDVPNDAPTT
ncbi:hypothetical protein V2J09_016388 [Rumex salicifolius]